MNRKRTPESSQPAGRARSHPALVAAIFLLLHMIPLVWRPNPSWGVDFLFFLPTPVQGMIVLIAVLLMVPGVRRRIRVCANALPFALWGRGPRVRFSRALVVLIALAGFVLLSTARHFLGDGYPVLENLEDGIWSASSRAPLSWALIRALHDMCQPYWETAENTYRFYSYASGVLYVLLAFPVASVLGKTDREKSVVFAFLLTAGYIQLFFGYVEHYPLFMPGLLLYILLGLQTLKQRLAPLCPRVRTGGADRPSHGLYCLRAIAGLPCISCLSPTAGRHPIPEKRTHKYRGTVLCPGHGRPFCWNERDRLRSIREPYGRQKLPASFCGTRISFAIPNLLAGACAGLPQSATARGPGRVYVHFPGRQETLRQSTLPRRLCICSSPVHVFRQPGDRRFSRLGCLLPACAAAHAVDRRGISGWEGRRQEPLRYAFVICGAAALHTLAWVGVNSSASAAQARFIHLADHLTGNAGVNSWMILGNFHETRKNDAAAFQAYKRALEVDPTNPNRWLTIGIFFRERQQSARAVEYFKKAQELQPDLAMPYMNLGAAYSDMRQFDKAIEYTRKAIALDPDLASAHLNLGAIYRRTAQHDKAIEHLEKASALRPNDGAIHGHLGMAYRSNGQNARAIRHLEKAHTLRPRHIVTLVNLAVAYSDEGHNSQAIELLKEAATLKPGLAAVHVNLGAVYGKIGKYEMGIQHLSHALELQPDNPETNKNLGLIYKAQGRYPEAIEHLVRALKLQADRGDLKTHLNIGETYFDMGQHEKAIPYYLTAVQLNPNHANAHLLLGLSYRALKRGDRARVHFEKTLELEPNHSHAARIKRWLERTRE